MSIVNLIKDKHGNKHDIGVKWHNVSSKPSTYPPSTHTHTSSDVSGLSDVATSGSYNDLIGKPTIPPAITIDSSMSSTSSNPVQNKVVNAELEKKRTIDQDVSKGANLVVNGNARMSSNYNWKNFKFYGSYTRNGSAGSFGFNDTGCCDEFISCDFTKKLNVSVDIRNLIEQPSNVVHRLYISEYDVDKNAITAVNVMFGVGTLTELTQDLKNGDTIVHLKDLSNENWKSSTSYHRGFIFWGYKNSYGYEYPPETYSRNVFPNSGSPALWEVAGVNQTDNTITLTEPWSFGTFLSGTKLSRRSSGATYPYPATGSWKDTEWHTLKGCMNGIVQAGTSVRTNKFSQGVAFFKIGVLPSYLTTAPSADDRRAVFTNMTAYEVADESSKAENVTGVVAIANGGTGGTTANTAMANLIRGMSDWQTPADDEFFPSASNTYQGKYTFLKLYNYIKSKLGSLATKSSVSDSDISGTISDTHISSASTWNAKQNALTAGSNITISGSTISATDTTYSETSEADVKAIVSALT